MALESCWVLLERHFWSLLPTIAQVDVVAAELLSETAMGDSGNLQTAILSGWSHGDRTEPGDERVRLRLLWRRGSARGWYVEEGDIYRVYLVDSNGQTIAVKYWSHEPSIAGLSNGGRGTQYDIGVQLTARTR